MTIRRGDIVLDLFLGSAFLLGAAMFADKASEEALEMTDGDKIRYAPACLIEQASVIDLDDSSLGDIVKKAQASPVVNIPIKSSELKKCWESAYKKAYDGNKGGLWLVVAGATLGGVGFLCRGGVGLYRYKKRSDSGPKLPPPEV